MTVAIIGAGLAGLVCAHRLQQHGIAATVFESSSTPGGRCTLAPYLLGPGVFSNTFQLIQDLGLSDRLRPIEPIAGQFYRGRVYRHRVASAAGLLGFKGLSMLDKAMLPRMAYLLARYASKLDIHHPEIGIDLDNESVAAFVKRELSQNILNYVAGPLISTLFFYGSEETSKLLYLNIALHMQNTRMQTISGGLSKLVDHLSRKIELRLKSPAGALEAEGTEYAIRGERFSNVVIAVEGNRVLAIDGLAGLLSEEDRTFFAECSYQRTVSVTLETERPVDGRCYAVSIPRVEGMQALTIAFLDFIDPESVATGHGKLAVTGSGDATATQLLDDLARIYPAASGLSNATTSEAGMPKFTPGRFRQIRDFLNRPRRAGLVFCGDYLMGPFLEAAVTTGLRAADAIAQNK